MEGFKRKGCLPCKGTKKRKYIGSPAAIIQWVLGESGMLETMQPA